jgi:ankyrin repeat protein
MLLQFPRTSDIPNSLSILKRRGEHIYVTPMMIEMVTKPGMLEKGVTELLLKQEGADIILLNDTEYGGMALEPAARGGHEAVVKLLIDNGANVKDIYGSIALESAARGGHEAIVKLLIDNGAEDQQLT